MGDLPRPRLMERVTPDRQGPLVSSLNTIIIIILNNIIIIIIITEYTIVVVLIMN